MKFEVSLPQKLAVAETEEFTLTATLSKDRPVTWCKNDKVITTEDSHYKISNVDTTHTLRVDKATLDDEASYTLTSGDTKTQTVVTVEGK